MALLSDCEKLKAAREWFRNRWLPGDKRGIDIALQGDRKHIEVLLSAVAETEKPCECEDVRTDEALLAATAPKMGCTDFLQATNADGTPSVSGGYWGHIKPEGELGKAVERLQALDAAIGDLAIAVVGAHSPTDGEFVTLGTLQGADIRQVLEWVHQAQTALMLILRDRAEGRNRQIGGDNQFVLHMAARDELLAAAEQMEEYERDHPATGATMHTLRCALAGALAASDARLRSAETNPGPPTPWEAAQEAFFERIGQQRIPIENGAERLAAARTEADALRGQKATLVAERDAARADRSRLSEEVADLKRQLAEAQKAAFTEQDLEELFLRCGYDPLRDSFRNAFREIMAAKPPAPRPCLTREDVEAIVLKALGTYDWGFDPHNCQTQVDSAVSEAALVAEERELMGERGPDLNEALVEGIVRVAVDAYGKGVQGGVAIYSHQRAVEAALAYWREHKPHGTWVPFEVGDWVRRSWWRAEVPTVQVATIMLEAVGEGEQDEEEEEVFPVREAVLSVSPAPPRCKCGACVRSGANVP